MIIVKPTASIALSACLLASCGSAGDPPAAEPSATAQSSAASAAPAAETHSAAPSSSASAATDGEDDGSPVIAPAPLTAEAAKTEKGARANLLAWARGIELREFGQAWELMGDAAKAQTSKARFTALFHPLRDITVAVPGGQMEGAAGSSYYTVPTTVTGTRADGSEARLEGEVVLRRVNDVPGATPAQLAWHIERVTLDPA